MVADQALDLKQQKDIVILIPKENVTWNPATAMLVRPPMFWDNPYWSRYEKLPKTMEGNRFIGNVSLITNSRTGLNFTRKGGNRHLHRDTRERRGPMGVYH